jgi:hypothetical protein
MDTINGNFSLLDLKNSSIEILDFGSGMKKKITVPARRSKFIIFFISPSLYIIPDDFFIFQNGFFLKTSNIIVNNYGSIYDKFGKLKSYILISKEENFIGCPDCDIWYDKDLIISKMSDIQF